MSLRCKLGIHDYRDCVTGRRIPHFILPSAEGDSSSTYWCKRCGDEKIIRYG